ncbi:MAG TPA: HlyD family efflux transporter periplasmic adaptor subunit [Rhodocyclaceae bacterium]|nr:HlyD family efflux transporter periplasmic adaptor subunit [Rhodocyclaceae bacterium]
MSDATTTPEKSSNAAATPASGTNGNGKKRKIGLFILLALLVVAGAAYAIYWFTYARWHETTDDAYVSGHVVQITPQIGGTVLAVHAEDTDMVKAGELLIEFDHADSRVTLDQAESALAQTVRQVRTVYANNSTLEAEVRQRQAEVDRWKEDIARRSAIADTGAVALEEIDHGKDSLKAAEAALAAANQQLASNRVLTDGSRVEQYPSVQNAASKVEEAWLDWSRSNVLAPVGGQVARRNVQIGQRVAPGTPLMAIVPLDSLWVDANFKEVQLRRMKIGQPAKVVADVYGDSVEYTGHVVGIGAGTGAAFALLPAQNATGNWIKVVQRVPVRIALDPRELAAHPLRVGLSMKIDVDTQSENGTPSGAPVQADNEDTMRSANTDVELSKAKTRAKEIIQQNIVAANRD